MHRPVQSLLHFAQRVAGGGVRNTRSAATIGSKCHSGRSLSSIICALREILAQRAVVRYVSLPMRIVGGKWAGRSLVSPAGKVRPTAEALRAAWMELLRDELHDARCLDLFAGSGAVGLEALSRGARSCDFVENGAAAIHALKANVAALHARSRSRIFDRDAIPFVERITRVAYEIAFADPPYGSRKLDRVLQRWLDQPFSRILSLEHAVEVRLPVKGRSTRVEDSVVTVIRR